MKMRKLLVFTIAAAFLVFGNLPKNLALAQNVDSAKLFRLKEIPAPKNDKSSLASVRESEIEFNFKNLSAIDREFLELEFFDAENYRAVRLETEVRSLDDFTWRGKITKEKFEGDVVLTFRKNYVSGLIYTPEKVYEIVPRGEKHLLVEIDQTKFPECAGDLKALETSAPAKTLANVGADVDSGDRIDVLVIYTAAVKVSLGGELQAQVFAQQSIDSTNTAYINSKIRQRVRLVRAQETTVVETGSLGTELSTIRSDAAIAALRNQYNADLVAMISNSSDNCGIGYLMGSANPLNGFTVTSRTCAIGNLSFAHELGHNMGSTHNPENGSAPTYPYGFGHYVNGVFRTVMSYSNPCASGCARRPYFSNPSIFFSGYPTGIEDARDNVRSINNTNDTIANYRYSGASLTLNSYNNGETLPRYINRTVSWGSNNLGGDVRIEISRDEGVSWQTIKPTTPNDGSETIVVSGRPTRLAFLRIVSLENPSVSDTSRKNFLIR